MTTPLAPARDAAGRFLLGHRGIAKRDASRYTGAQRKERARVRRAYLAAGRSPRWAAARANAYLAATELLAAIEAMTTAERVSMHAARSQASALVLRVIEETEQTEERRR